MSRNVFLSVDATGLYTHIDRVLEIVALEAVDLVLTGVQFHVVLNPQHEMHDEVTKITGYQDEQLAGLPTFGDIASALVRFVKDSDLVVANASWDIDLIDAELIRLGMLTLAHHTHHMSDVSSNGLKPNLNIRLNMDKLALLYDCREPVQACSHGWKSCFRLAQMYLKHYRKAKPSMNIIELEKSVPVYDGHFGIQYIDTTTIPEPWQSQFIRWLYAGKSLMGENTHRCHQHHWTEWLHQVPARCPELGPSQLDELPWSSFGVSAKV